MKIVLLILLLFLVSCSQLNMHENEDVCYLHIYVELPDGYSEWKGGFIQFLRDYTEEERKTLSPYILRNIDGVERFKSYKPTLIIPHYENLIKIKKELFVLIKDTIHFRLRGFGCFLNWPPPYGALNDFMLFKQGDTIYKHYDFRDKKCIPIPDE